MGRRPYYFQQKRKSLRGKLPISQKIAFIKFIVPNRPVDQPTHTFPVQPRPIYPIWIFPIRTWIVRGGLFYVTFVFEQQVERRELQWATIKVEVGQFLF